MATHSPSLPSRPAGLGFPPFGLGALEGRRPCACANCDWTGDATDALPCRDFWSRVEPGDIVPAGDCPVCEAFVFPASETSPPERTPSLAAAQSAADLDADAGERAIVSHEARLREFAGWEPGRDV